MLIPTFSSFFPCIDNSLLETEILVVFYYSPVRENANPLHLRPYVHWRMNPRPSRARNLRSRSKDKQWISSSLSLISILQTVNQISRVGHYPTIVKPTIITSLRRRENQKAIGHGESEQKVDDVWVVVQLLVNHHGHDAHLGSTAIQLDTKRRQNTQPTWSS